MQMSFYLYLTVDSEMGLTLITPVNYEDKVE